MAHVLLTIWRNSWHLAQRGEKYTAFWREWRYVSVITLNRCFELNAIDLDQPLLITTDMLMWLFSQTETGACELLQRPNAHVSANIYHELWAWGARPSVIIRFAKLASTKLPPFVIGAGDLVALPASFWYTIRDTVTTPIPFAAFGDPANITTELLHKLVQERAYYDTIMAHPAIAVDKKRAALDCAPYAPSTA